MAESPNTKPATPKGPSPLLKGVSSFLKITTWLSVGLVFLFLGVICKIKRPVPAAWEPFFALHLPHLPYFVCGFGFICLGHARSMLRHEYKVEQKKDYFYAHAWKISLLGTQVFLLYAAGLYAILFGLNVIPAIGMLGLVIFISCFFLYLLLYQIEYFKNRLPALTALRISAMGFVFAGISFGLWTVYQMIIPSLILSFLGIYAGVYALTYSNPLAPQKGGLLKYIFVIGTVVLLGSVGYYVLDFWKPQTVPLNTVPITKGLRGEIGNLVFSPKGNEIVFNQKLGGEWFIQMLNADSQASVTVKLPDVDGSFRSVFVDDGKSLLADTPQDDKRQLVKIDVATGALTVLVKEGVEPFSGGLPWSDLTNQFLFVTQGKKGYSLNSWTPDKAKPLILYSSKSPILSPSWIDEGEIAYVDGTDATPYVLDIKKKTATPIISDEETKVTGELIETDPLVEILPSPDDFRYLCVGQKDGKTTLWTMLMDGTKRVEIYKTDDHLSDIAWLTNGQKIVFQRTGLERGFKNKTKGIVILDANLRSTEDLIPPQINSHSPAISPDGIKIAFVGSEGLWYPSLDSGIWVDVLR